ncbi:unnamed protein product [Acanthoscelides obtectus]|uniref:Protein twisted gastrulation n=1 Tax=Acanthoscelides obtectus TaxID=200917 RepID=A0A9P0KZ47_ACAOB|nr:unnamed protein product [Acanthoscelides obtectus]CAK1652681.1 Protein twisted gastrulation [Acanthoscelides obtectus]
MTGLVLFVFGFLAESIRYSFACNEAVCGSIVSKCLLIKSCSCDLATKPCAKECFNCLGVRYHDCCSCVDMCPETEEDLGSLNKQSVVEDFQEAVPQLFEALTEFPDQLGQWSALEVPVNINIKGQDDTITAKSRFLSVNCTVVFWTQCMSWQKCRNGCISMGASSYRWFHDGCCECIGQSCVNYGLDENRCPQCPKNRTETSSVIEMGQNDLDYGEEDDMLDYGEEDV